MDLAKYEELGIISSKKSRNKTTYETQQGDKISITTNKKGEITNLMVGKHKILVGGLDEKEIVSAIQQAQGTGIEESQISISSRDLKQLMNYDEEIVNDLIKRRDSLTQGSGKFVVYAPEKGEFLSEKMGLTKDNLKIKIYDTKAEAFEDATEENNIEYVVVEI
jgi:hypothetical protein